jgi:hypothetical protein
MGSASYVSNLLHSEAIKKSAQSWRVLGGISALGDRSTFMPARKNRPAGQMSQPEKENYGNNL